MGGNPINVYICSSHYYNYLDLGSVVTKHDRMGRLLISPPRMHHGEYKQLINLRIDIPQKINYYTRLVKRNTDLRATMYTYQGDK